MCKGFLIVGEQISRIEFSLLDFISKDDSNCIENWILYLGGGFRILINDKVEVYKENYPSHEELLKEIMTSRRTFELNGWKDSPKCYPYLVSIGDTHLLLCENKDGQPIDCPERALNQMKIYLSHD